MTKKIKRCPECGCVNDEYKYICDNDDCRCSLMNVLPEEADKLNKKSIEVERSKGFKNNCTRPVIAHTELTDNMEALLEHPGPPVFAFKVNNGAIAGRSGSIDLTPLANSNFISGQHVRFYLQEGIWYLENMSNTNKTLVNGVDMIQGGRHILKDGDLITMANTTFIFRVKLNE